MDNARERMRETSGRVPRARGPTATRDARLDGRKFTVRVRINDWKKTDSPFTSLIEIAEERRIADAQGFLTIPCVVAVTRARATATAN